MTPAERAALAHAVDRAAAIVAPSWPLERFVAVNPLVGLVDAGFDAAVEEARDWLGVRGHPGLRPGHRQPRALETACGADAGRRVDDLVHRWLPALLGTRTSTPPYQAWRALAQRDRDLRRLVGRRALVTLADLPDRPDDATLAALARLGVAPPDHWAELRAQLVRSLGWAAYATWCGRWAAPDDPAPRLGLVDLLAIRTVTDALALEALPLAMPAPPPPRVVGEGSHQLDRAEAAFRSDLVGRLRRAPRAIPPAPRAQVVCCIDARSEGLRRHLEAIGPYETLGFAGFFGVPARVRPLGSAEAHQAAPVLLRPTIEVIERPAAGDPPDVPAIEARRGRHDASTTCAQGASAFGWAEAAGWAVGAAALARTFRPSPSRAARTPASRIDVTAFDLAERAGLVDTALATMGLNGPLAPVVVLCGHGATTEANPHGAALDCGACAGQRGGASARALATMANDPAVRARLAERGRLIGDETVFVAAEHDTTTDEVTLLDLDAVPRGRRPEIDAVASDLSRAGQHLARERAADLPRRGGRPAPAAARRRAADWSEVRPEWGLARNAAFIVAPRAVTAGVDLERRAFLHSYDPTADVDGTALETILTAPMVVAHWINLQYYASTVDPEVLGAGDKALHNPIPGIGVLSGGGGDLRVGLPWQSVAADDGLYHEPLRLLAIVEAPVTRVRDVIDRNPVLQHLFDGAWVHLVIHPPGSDHWYRRLPGGVLDLVTPQEAPCPSPA